MRGHVFAVTITALLAGELASADVKISANYNNDGKVSETTIYSNGSRLRYEYGKGLVLLHQCDLNRMVQVDDKARTFMVLPTVRPDGVPGSAAEGPGNSRKAEVTDTNEQKDMFGYPARHLKITQITEGKSARTETDGWYVDLKGISNCPGPLSASTATGYPVSYTVTSYGENGKPASSVSMRVSSLVTAPLDPALFEIPRGYAESNPQAAAMKIAPKSAGSVRIGAVSPQTQSGQNVHGAPFGQLMAQLQAAQLEVVPLSAGSPDAVQQKARDVECDYVLYTELASLAKPQSGKVGGFLHKTPGLGHMTGGDALEAQVAYRLVPAGGGSPVLASSVTGKTGGSFDWKSAAMLATNFFPMTMAVRMMGGAFNPAMMSGMLSGRGSGGALAGMDPMMGTLTMFLRAASPSDAAGNAAQNPAAADAAIGAAFDQVGKAVIAQLKRSSN